MAVKGAAVLVVALVLWPASAASAEMNLALVADFPATAYLDGQRAGLLPVRISDIPPGRHQVALRLTSGAGRAWTFNVPVGRRVQRGLIFTWRGSDPFESYGGLETPPYYRSIVQATRGVPTRPVDPDSVLLPIGVEVVYEDASFLDYPLYAYQESFGGGFCIGGIRHRPIWPIPDRPVCAVPTPQPPVAVAPSPPPFLRGGPIRPPLFPPATVWTSPVPR
jgi:hypothetical protein